MKTMQDLINNVPEWIERAHAQAVKSGFHDEPLTDVRLCNLIVSELFEAFEFYRKGWALNTVKLAKDGVFQNFDLTIDDVSLTSDGCIDFDVSPTPHTFGLDAKTGYKLEGIPIDLADFLIRIFDACGLRSYKLSIYPIKGGADFDQYMRNMVDGLYQWSYSGGPGYFNQAVTETLAFCIKEGIDIEKSIEIKMAYNSTREYKHGKAF